MSYFRITKSKTETACLVLNALVVLCSALIVVAHLVIPINLTTVYVGKLVVIGGALLALIGLLILIELPLLFSISSKKSATRFQVYATFWIAIFSCFAFTLITAYLTGIGLGKLEHPHYSVWLGLTTTLLLATYYWRKH
jgi:hypothetical protein